MRVSGGQRATRPSRCWRSWSRSGARPRSGWPARSATSPPRTPGSTATRSACRPPAGLPDSFLEPVEDADARAGPPLRRHPRPLPHPPARRALRRSIPRRRCASSSAQGDLVRGELLPGGTEREWCDADVLRRVRRASLARLRKEVEATDRSELARFLPSWQNVDAHRPSRRRPRPPARGAGPAAGGRADPEDLGARRAAAPPRHLQPGLARRALHQRRAGLDRRGRARPQRRQGRPLLPRGRAASPARRPSNAKLEPPEGEVHDAIRERLVWRAGFWLDLLELDGSGEELHEALWDLAWAGEVTNDAFAPLRAPRLRAAQRPRARRPALRQPPRRRGRDRARPLVADRAAVRGRAAGRARGCARRPS